MPQSLPSFLYHLIFSTKNRDPFITADIESKLHAYMAGVCTQVGGRPIVVNGMPDHVHVLTYLPPKVAVSDVLRDLKAWSSKWVHTTFPGNEAFAWQAGYAGFSVSKSNLEQVRDYIANQKDHHRAVSFQDEYLAFLRRHGIAFDERYVWD